MANPYEQFGYVAPSNPYEQFGFTAPAAAEQAPQATPGSDKPWYERMLGGAHIASPEEFAQRSGVIPNPGATVDAVKDFLFSPESAQAMRKTLAGFVPRSATQAAEFATPVVGAVESIADAGKRISDVARGEPLPQEKTFPEFTKQDWYDFGTGNASQLVMAALTGKGLFKAGAAPKGAPEGPVARPEAKAVSEPPPIEGTPEMARVQPEPKLEEIAAKNYDVDANTLISEALKFKSREELRAGADEWLKGYGANPADVTDPMMKAIALENSARNAIRDRLAKPAEPATVPPDEFSPQKEPRPLDERAGQPGTVPEQSPGMETTGAPQAGEAPRGGAIGEEVGGTRPGSRGKVFQREQADVSELSPDTPEGGIRLADEVTGIANKVTEAERAKRGLPEAGEPEAHSWQQAMREAQSRDAEGATLVEELKANPRALVDVEDALLLREQIKAQKAHDAAVLEVNEKPGDTGAQNRLDVARDKVQAIYDVDKAVGVEHGRGFNARKMLAAQDFTLAKMEATVRAEANKGKPLSPKQAGKVKQIHERIQKADDKLAEYDEFKRFYSEARKAPTAPKPEFLKSAYDRAKQRITERRGKLTAGYDPTAIVDEAIVGAYHISRGVTNFAHWSKVMVQELGERIKPYLQDLWKRSNAMHAETDRALASARTEKLKADKSRIRKGIGEYRKRTSANDTSPLRPKREQLIDKEKTKLLFERESARKEYHEMLARERFKKAPWYRKAGHYVSEFAVGVPRSIKSAFDLSAVFRQGGLLVSGHPIKGARNIAPMLKALTSDEAQFAVMQGIRESANYPRYKRSKLEITEPGSGLSPREEVFRSELAEKIPGVAASERAFTTYLNKLRTDSFDGMTGLLEKSTRRKLTPGEERIIANYINVASGRGNMGRFAPAANALAKVFWSPRLAVSRIQYLAAQPLWHNLGSGSVAVRLLVAGEYARTIAGIGVMVGLAKMAGADIETDPRSGNWGIRFGDTRLDVTAGLKTYINYFSRIATSKYKNQKGEVKNLGENKMSPTFGSLTGGMIRQKLAPGQGSIFNAFQGETPVGQPTSAINEALGFYLPLSPQDVGDALKTEGVPQKAVLSLLAIGGMSTNNYEPSSGADKKAKKATIEERDKAILHGDIPRAAQLTFGH